MKPNTLGTVYVRPGDSIIGLATRHYGYPGAWRELAAANGLESPYIVADRSGMTHLRVLGPGDPLVLPVLGDRGFRELLRVEYDAYGIDLGWGHTSYDLLLEGNILGLDRGLENLMKALYRRIITRPGELPGRPSYGCRVHEHLGKEATPARAKLAALDVRAAMLQDPRVVDAAVEATWHVTGALHLVAEVTPIPPNEVFTMPITIGGSRRAQANL